MTHSVIVPGLGCGPTLQPSDALELDADPSLPRSPSDQPSDGPSDDPSSAGSSDGAPGTSLVPVRSLAVAAPPAVPSMPNVLVDAAGGREFRLIRRLGEGGFGTVHLATVRSASGLEQQVAVKLLLPEVDPRNQAIERLFDEAVVLASLRHPVILAAHDLVRVETGVALVTEYVEGQDLRECMSDTADPITNRALVDVIGQVASALDAAWTSVSIVHRDVKPQNIRIGRHGNVKLLDFGLARSTSLPREAQTQANIVMGSLAYLAPERFHPDRPPHPGTDVFALGCVLFEAVTGGRLFDKLGAEQMYGLASAPPVFDAYVRRQLTRPMPEPMRALLGRMLAYAPDDRIRAGELAWTCDALAAEARDDLTLRMWCRRRWDPGQDPSEASLLNLRSSIKPPPPREATPDAPGHPAPRLAEAPSLASSRAVPAVVPPAAPARVAEVVQSELVPPTGAALIERRSRGGRWFGLAAISAALGLTGLTTVTGVVLAGLLSVLIAAAVVLAPGRGVEGAPPPIVQPRPRPADPVATDPVPVPVPTPSPSPRPSPGGPERWAPGGR
ncbi:MAG: serine/threonine-protein kinase [Myxococcota bacterium]